MRIGIDIGGTFTDTVAVDERTGEIILKKVPTVPRKVELGVKNGIKKMGIKPSEISQTIHATTLGSNTVISRTGPTVGCITTKGFRDLLLIARGTREKMYDLYEVYPTPLVPGWLREEVDERIDPLGRVVVSLNEEEVRKIATHFKKNHVESIAVCFLWSFLNPIHEERTRKIIKNEYPTVHISLSSDIAPEIREFERLYTTVVNAYISPTFDSYLLSLMSDQDIVGPSGELLMMQSNGGITVAATARERPIRFIESGPTAGVVAASYLGRLIGYPNLISFDMGGTTAKLSLVEGNLPKMIGEIMLESNRRIKIPSIDMIEIGSGGGSIAWIAPDGTLQVGPKSAGADPGPACYGKGGVEPTVTDALVIMKHINPDYFLGGEMKIYPEKAEKAMYEKIAEPLGLDVVEAAYGICRIAMSKMADATVTVSVRRGYDPAEFVLISFGGAGPLFGALIADELKIASTISTIYPGSFSALGLLLADYRHDVSRSYPRHQKNVSLDEMNHYYRQMESTVIEELTRDGVSPEDMKLMRSADVRYFGQMYELNVPVPSGELNEGSIEQIANSFYETHRRVYEYGVQNVPIEFITLRVVGLGPSKKPVFKKLKKGDEEPSQEALKEMRQVFIVQCKDFQECPVYDRDKLLAGNLIKGPAVVEEIQSTTYIPDGHIGSIDEFGNILIKRHEK